MIGTIGGIVLKFHILVTPVSRSLYFDSFSASLFTTFRSDGTDMSNENTFVFLLVFNHDIGSLGSSLLVSMNWHIP